MFEINETTQARLATVTNRVEKHGDDEKPAVSLGLEITTANTVLDAIDPKLREALFKPKPDATPELPGVEQSTPVLRCNSIERVTLPNRHEGWTLCIDADIDEDAPMVFGSIKLDKVSVEPQQGGSVVLRLRCGTSDVDADRLGWLAMHNGESIWIRLTAPQKQPEAIDGTKGHPGAQPDATDLFAAEHGPEDDDSEVGETDIEDDEDAGPELEVRLDNALATADAEARGDNWPFPKYTLNMATGKMVDSDGNEKPAEPEPAAPASKRTARGREATKKALAEGLAAHEAAQAAGAE